MTRSRLLWATTSVVFAVTTIAFMSSALAHTNVAESDPADGVRIDAAPASVMVRFGQEGFPAPGQITDARLEVYDECGTRVDKNDSTVNMENSSVTVSSGGTLAGRYEIHWYAVAADGAEQTGVLDFSVVKGDPCGGASRPDAKDDTEVGPDVTLVGSKRTSKGAIVSLAFDESVGCRSLAAKAEDHLKLMLDTNSDRNADFTGDVTCRRGVWSMKLESSEGDATGSLAVRRTTSTTLRFTLPKGKLVAHADVWVESSSEADECETKICFDRAPELGLMRAY